jgi:TfoX/Sxy family transcriptional regulator of competence genes
MSRRITVAYNEELLERIRRVVDERKDVTEKKMFGGVAFMANGNMACGPHGDNLIVRIGAEAAAEAMKQPHVKPMDFTGRVMSTFATIEPAGVRTEAQLRRWVEMSIAYAAAQPAKKRAKKKKG